MEKIKLKVNSKGRSQSPDRQPVHRQRVGSGRLGCVGAAEELGAGWLEGDRVSY